MSLTDPRFITLGLAAAMLLSGGCMRRTIEISTEPEGALVWLNGREVGRTPVEVNFNHYGTYDLMIQKKGWEPIIDERKAPVPVSDTLGLDLVVEILPVDVHHKIHWHIEMEPRDTSTTALIDRADALRSELPGGDEKTTDVTP